MRILRSSKNWSSLFRLFCVCLSLFTVAVAADDTTTTTPDAAGHFDGWQNLGPSGGDVRAIVVDPKDKNHLLISTLDGQVYSSPDAGKSWQWVVSFDRPQLVLDNLIIDSRDSKTIYASGHRPKDGGFFKSKDSGVTWKEAKELKDEPIHAMIQSSKDPNILLVGTTRGVWMSTNSGDDWKRIDSATNPINVDSLAIDPTDANTFYAGTFWRAYKTTDSGKNWRLIKDGMIDDSDVFAIDIDPRNPNHIIASACSGIYDSQNKGEKWAKVNGIPSQSRRTRDIMQHPSVAGTVYAATTEGFWMSTDNGKSWSLTTTRQLEINSITVHPDDPNRVYIGTNNYGVMVSNDGGKNFSQTNGNFSSRLTYSVVPDVERSNRLYATTINTATGGGFLFISDDGGSTWQPITKNITGNNVIPYTLLQDKTNPNTIFMATNVGMYRSMDRGINWIQMTAPPAVKSVKRKAVIARTKKTVKAPVKTEAQKAAEAAEAMAAQNHLPALTEKINTLVRTDDGKNGMLAGTGKGLYRTYDPAKGWDKISFGIGLDQQVFAVTVESQNPNTIWVGTSSGGLIVTKDGGTTWEKVADVPNIVPVVAVAVDPTNSQNVYVGTAFTFYVSRDGGKSWSRKGGNLPVGNYNSILINPKNPDEIFVGSALETNGGIYQSVNGGKNWKRLDNKDVNLASRRVWSMTFDPNNSNRIFAGTHSSGIFRVDRAPVTASNTGSTNSSETITRPRVSTSGN